MLAPHQGVHCTSATYSHAVPTRPGYLVRFTSHRRSPKVAGQFSAAPSPHSHPLHSTRHSLASAASNGPTIQPEILQQPVEQQQQQVASNLQLQHRCKSLFLWTTASVACLCLSNLTSGAALASTSSALPAGSSEGASIIMKSAWTGLGAGFLHTLCGPDHLAALTPLTIGRNRVVASALGALWGFGHSTGQLILGVGMVLLKERFHDFLPALERWSGTVVGLTLLAIGGLGIYESHFEKHEEGEGEGHAEEEAEAMEAALAKAGAGKCINAKASLATYATGIVYGLQPDALFVVVPALTLPSRVAAVAYCSMFVLGTVVAMGGYTAVIGTTSAALVADRPWLQSHLSTIASLIAVVVGGLILAAGAGFNVPFFG